MTMLTESVDAVIGVDTHRDTLAAAAVSTLGAVLADTQVGADAPGYAALLDFAAAHAPGRRCWAVEGAGSYGAGLAIFLAAHGERVVEVARPKRPARAGARKSDQSTPCALPGKRSAPTTSSFLVAVATVRHCGC